MDKICGDNSIVEYPLFQTECGGAIPTSPLHISTYQLFKCQWQDLVPILKRFHYRGSSMGGSIKCCLGVYAEGRLIGGAVLGNPWHIDTYAAGGGQAIELRRLVFVDEAPKNTESWAIGKICWWLQKYTTYARVLSYSDSGAGHTGTIYKAAGFTLVGESGGGKQVMYNGRAYHMRSLTIDRDYARELAEAVKTGDAEVVETGVKRIWLRELRPKYKSTFHRQMPVATRSLFEVTEI